MPYVINQDGKQCSGSLAHCRPDQRIPLMPALCKDAFSEALFVALSYFEIRVVAYSLLRSLSGGKTKKSDLDSNWAH